MTKMGPMQVWHVATAILVVFLTAWGPAAAGSTPAAAERPQRVVSLNLCTDQLLVQLAEPERIASVSVLAADPLYSAVADRAQGLPVNHGQAEEVLRQNPDLVLTGTFGNRSTVHLLRRLGYPVVQIGPPRDLTDVRRQIRKIADALGVPARGRALIRRLDTRLAAAAPQERSEDRVTVAIYQPNGIVVGRNELPHAVATAAGLSNLAADQGMNGMSPLALERLLVARPDVLILQSERDPAPSQATELLRHPALQALAERSVVTRIPRRLWSCGGPQVAEAVRRLAQARREAH
ncbi:ABC transporter substrate-binding protein [Rhodovibrio salinarum]|uniref:ABC transporter substrate-binding protein n=1 Tax=Rhodovibrio salinarum TaxID=1087 RepID=A0A934QJL5_9PROT|nr:ABC transporter substrate-binding protein [Rhodovibrio salinarum]MBK1697877.1 ABC transporter substrate-binding protein [Rhodovibrio salinarum]